LFLLKYSKLLLFAIPLAIALPAALLFAADNLPFWPVIVIIVAAVTAVFYITNLVYMHKLRNAVKSLEDDCDPAACLKQLDQLIAACNSRVTMQSLLVNKSGGLFALGDVPGGLELLNKLDIDKYNGLPRLIKKCYYNNLASGYMLANDFDKAEFTLNKLDLMIQNEKISARYEKPLKMFKASFYELKVLKGETDGCEEYYNRFVESAASRKSVIYGKFMLGKLFLMQGKTAEGRELLNYVIKNGSRLFEAERARVLIDSLS
jgi:hypothetical protein